ncbi:neprilysin-2-like isoform X2 [Photinus pyralis]|uniref:neprilysin-2-like isoform X2 n=1 Tax=Photinus pyralis TaxID=7054 RepID=UPI001267738E|nr:neprilysin-2-like isoform X2 [Photinus pyralis]
MDYLFRRKKKRISYETLMQLAFPKATVAIITSTIGDRTLFEETYNRFTGVRDSENFIHDDTIPAIIGRLGETVSQTKWKLKKTFKRNKEDVVSAVVKLLWILCVILAIVIIALLIKRSPKPICLTQGCIKSAHYALKYMDTSVEPCTNFYDFACGGFIKKTIVDPPHLEVNIFSKMTNIVNQQLKSLIIEPLPQNLTRPYQLLKTMCNLCHNETQKEGVKVIEEILARIGGWPMMKGSKWDINSFHWADMILKLKDFGLPYSHFFSVNVEHYLDDNNTLQNIIQLKTSGISSSIKNDTYLYDIVKLFDLEESKAAEDIQSVVLFMNNLSTIFKSPNNREMVIEDMINVNNILQGEHWLSFFKNLFKRSQEEILQKSPLIAFPPTLKQLLNLLNETNKRVQANYLFFETVIWMFHYADDHLRYIGQRISNARNPPRWYECFQDMHKSNGTKNAVEALIVNIRTELLKLIEASKWLDAETKKNAVEKALSMASYVGYPPPLEEPGVLDAYYKELKIDTSSYLKSIMSITIFNSNKTFNKLFQSKEETKWITHADTTVINAYYMPSQNCIDISVAILNEPIFGTNRPSYINYAKVGMIIGHEMMHGFDHKGSKYDKNGNLANWWSKESLQNFVRKAKCIEKQYSNYTFPGLHRKVDGKHTLGENIADNIGLQIAHLAYKTWRESNEPENKLPGLNYTRNQQFWISFAQTWCQKLQDNYPGNVFDVHSPPRYRVIGTLTNLREFARDFKCPKHSPMNPPQKCDFW